ncbi:MAG: FISUMP domain-containing protein, partial [Bacteroidales bacterium]|nr:FISUMP domain-containing protein [Bacteroidales bacterium]
AVVRGDSGFNALPAGYFGRDDSKRPYHAGIGDFAYFWAATTATPANKGWSRYLYSMDDVLHPHEEWKVFGYSVRCLRN